MSKFAVNAVQQIDSAIMSGLQRMLWIAVFSAGDETSSTSTMFWPTKAMDSRPVRRPLEKHGYLECLVALTARVVSMSIQTWDGGMIQRQTSDIESQQGTVAHCHEGSGGQEHINEIRFSLEPSASEVLGGVALRVLTSLLRTPVEQQHWILIASYVAVFQTCQLALYVWDGQKFKIYYVYINSTKVTTVLVSSIEGYYAKFVVNMQLALFQLQLVKRCGDTPDGMVAPLSKSAAFKSLGKSMVSAKDGRWRCLFFGNVLLGLISVLTLETEHNYLADL